MPKPASFELNSTFALDIRDGRIRQRLEMRANPGGLRWIPGLPAGAKGLPGKTHGLSNLLDSVGFPASAAQAISPRLLVGLADANALSARLLGALVERGNPLPWASSESHEVLTVVSIRLEVDPPIVSAAGLSLFVGGAAGRLYRWEYVQGSGFSRIMPRQQSPSEDLLEELERAFTPQIQILLGSLGSGAAGLGGLR
jgi:hypothetical protein